MTRKQRRLIVLACTLAVLGVIVSACSPGYFLRAAWEQAKILNGRQPIAPMVDDPAVPAATRAKLALVLQARDFAADSLGLDAGDSYTLYSEVESDTLAMVLSAARRDTFAAYTWWFPIVGRVPYKGFFREEDAYAEARKLEARGFDTYVRPTAAFSTLGWFNDPLLNTLLRYDEVSLANTVIHEILHNTFYAAGEAAFNESFASFVGSRGAIDFFCRRDGPDAPRCRTATAAWEDDLVFGRFMNGLVGELEALYARPDLTPAQKVAARERIFEAARVHFRAEVQPALRVSSFGNFLTMPLNNATLISRRLYYDRLDLFERVYQARGGDLRRTIDDVLAAARAGGDPYAAVEALVPAGAKGAAGL